MAREVRRRERRPVPPLALRLRIGHPSIHGFLAAGERWADAVEIALAAASDRLDDHEEVLDFGCGAGKVLGVLDRRYPDLAVHAVDLHEPSIEWVRRAYPGAAVQVNGYLPPLDLKTGGFDLIYAWSVFTHLPESVQPEWLRELRRVVTAGGTLLVSVNLLRPDGSFANEQLRDLFSRDDLISVGFSFAETFARDPVLWHGSTERYGHAAHTPAYIERVWTEQGFDVVSIVPDAIAGAGGQQDVAVLRAT